MSSNKQDYLIGYGSLLSHDSRSRFSNVVCPNIPVVVHGWRREWLARGLAEFQTGLGVSQVESASLNAVLLPIEQISDELRHREQDYRFVQVDHTKVTASQQSPLALAELAKISADPEHKKIWICANLHKYQANLDYPIYQTYIDTCLVGCFDSSIDNFAADFIQNTHFWQHTWINDRHKAQYPRAATVTQEQQKRIDELLEHYQVLRYRQQSTK